MTQKIVFTGTRDFEALNKATAWCRANGYSYGSMQADAPTGLLRGACEIAKWRNLTASEREALDGVLDAPGRKYRAGPVTITLGGAR
jgi:hypothetical protein